MRKKITVLGLGVLIICALILSGCGSDNTTSSTSSSTTSSSTFSGVLAPYEGSSTCKTCHAANHAGWEATLHTMKIREVVGQDSTGVIICDSDNDGTNDFEEAPTTTTNGITGDTFAGMSYATWLLTERSSIYYDTNAYWIQMDWDTNASGTIRKSFQVKYVLGGAGWKQRYMTEFTTSSGIKLIYILNLQYNKANNQWTSYTGSFKTSARGDGVFYAKDIKPQKTWNGFCIGCHATGVEAIHEITDADPIYVLEADDSVTLTNAIYAVEGTDYVEKNIGCEACHGGGANHVSLGGGQGTIKNPDDMGPEAANAVCGRCHLRGESTYKTQNGNLSVDYPAKADELTGDFTTFHPGDVLDGSFYELNYSGSKAHKDRNRTSLGHHQQWMDYAKSEHYEAGVTCFDCHDPHAKNFEHSLKKEAKELCLDCHSSATYDVESHTHHPEGAGSPDCVKCHMPKDAASALKYDITNHNFHFVYPETNRSTRVKTIPNGCSTQECHSQFDASPADDKWNPKTALYGQKFEDIITDALVDSATINLANKWGTDTIQPVAWIYTDANFDDIENVLEYSVGTNIALDGSKSYDPTDTSTDKLTYAWVLGNAPDGGLTSINNAIVAANAADSSILYFTPAAGEEGNYKIGLVVKKPKDSSDSLASEVAYQQFKVTQ